MNIIKTTKYMAVSAVLCAAVSATSCHDDRVLLQGEGTLRISATVKSDVKVASRARATEDLAGSCLIHIYNGKGLVRKYEGLDQVPAEGIKLVADNYVAEAWAGDSVSASFDDRWFKGREEFAVGHGQVTDVDLVCRIANVVAAVEYEQAALDMLQDCKVTVGHTRGSLDFVGQETRRGYFMMPNNVNDLTWTLEATQTNGETVTRTGTISGVKPATLYTLNIRFTPGSAGDLSGACLTIEVDESELLVEDEIVLTVPPVIIGHGFDLDKPLYGEAGKMERTSVYAAAVGQTTSLVIANDLLPQLLGISGNRVDLFNASADVCTQLENAGLDWNYKYDAESNTSQTKINFEQELLAKLPEGEHSITITATGAEDLSSSKTLTIVLTNADVMAKPVNDTDVWATSATVTADILKSGITGMGIGYRLKGTQAFITVTDVTVNGNSYSAVLNGLEPGKTYEYVAIADGFTSSDVRQFTTEAAQQIPNGDFEDWHKNGKILFPYAQGGAQFWDTGNTGSSTMSVNVTNNSTEKYHSGTQSAKLESQFVGIAGIGKFAAGNIFVGEYLKTDGTDGVLGWGRNFSNRPKALTGWIHYTPQPVTNTKLSSVSKGDMDSGIIYIAILDASTKEYESKNYPVIVRTKQQELFSKDDPNVIAYGQMVFDSATPGDAMVSFRIPLDYKRTDIKAANIMIVASASRYGDYFTGGPSVMYLDDFKLEY